MPCARDVVPVGSLLSVTVHLLSRLISSVLVLEFRVSPSVVFLSASSSTMLVARGGEAGWH